MKFVKTEVPGVIIIDIDRIEDERGFFARTFCRDEFSEHGLRFDLAQCNASFNKRKGTLRGMHYQVEPHREAKLVRCTMGAIYDVALDARQESSTCGKWIGVELSAGNRRMLYIPEGIAHGFQTLADDTEVFYQMSEFHHPECARGILWNDPAFGITWPLKNPVMSGKDRSYSPYAGQER